MKKILFLSVIFIFFGISCSSDDSPNNPDSSAPADLVGKKITITDNDKVLWINAGEFTSSNTCTVYSDTTSGVPAYSYSKKDNSNAKLTFNFQSQTHEEGRLIYHNFYQTYNLSFSSTTAGSFDGSSIDSGYTYYGSTKMYIVTTKTNIGSFKFY